MQSKLHTLLYFSTVTTISKSKHVPMSQSLLLQLNTGLLLERTFNSMCPPGGTLCDNYLLDSASEGGWKSAWNPEILRDRNNLTWQKIYTLAPGVCLAWGLLCVCRNASWWTELWLLLVYFNPFFSNRWDLWFVQYLYSLALILI